MLRTFSDARARSTPNFCVIQHKWSKGLHGSFFYLCVPNLQVLHLSTCVFRICEFLGNICPSREPNAKVYTHTLAYNHKIPETHTHTPTRIFAHYTHINAHTQHTHIKHAHARRTHTLTHARTRTTNLRILFIYYSALYMDTWICYCMI